MKRHLWTVLIALSLLLSLAAPALADGMIITDPPITWPCVETPPCADCRPPCPPPLSNLTVKYHRVTVTIEDQVATTHVDQLFLNPQPYEVEGTYVFPLPLGATVSDFAMWVDGTRVEAKVLDRDQARAIYNSIVQQRRDPALLEYIDRGAVQASVFPIPAGGERRIELTYSQILSFDNGLARYVYGLDTERFSQQPLEQASVSVTLRSKEPLKAVYSPSHAVTISRDGDYAATIAYEESDVLPDRDFELDYTVSAQDVGLNLLSYRTGADDGFFVLLVAPSVTAKDAAVVDKDVLLVLDTSGSMEGEKITQAQSALQYVLGHLNPNDRFNVIAFNTSTRAYASGPRPASEAAAAQDFVAGLRAEGGTDINRALLEAIGQADRERPTILIFLTDGLPTVGEVNPDTIAANIGQAAPQNVRLFAFGVGDDVDAVLLDTLAADHRGTTAYVRPGGQIDEQVSAFYAKVQTPLLADLALQIVSSGESITLYDVYPQPLPDLFAGTQLVVTGRYRGSGPARAVLTGQVNGQLLRYEYADLTFAAGGDTGKQDEFVPRLWATRRIGYLLAEIRRNGENKEVVDEIVALSVRYGIITPYTSFLVQENDILTEAGRERAADDAASKVLALPASGAPAVEASATQSSMQSADSAHAPNAGSADAQAVRVAGAKTFVLQNSVWTDTTFDPEHMTAQKLGFASDAYFALAGAHADLASYLAVAPHMIVVYDGVAYEVVEGGGDVQPPVAQPTPVPGVTAVPAATAAPGATATPAAAPEPGAAIADGGIDFRPAAYVAAGLAALLVVAVVLRRRAV
jgi:Ca-activated chloride channel family protein